MTKKLTTMNIHLMNLTEILNKYCHNDEHVWLNMTENPKYNIQSSSIVDFHRCGIIFYIFYFRSNSIIFGRVQQVNVPRCHFLVMFKQIWFVSLVIFKSFLGHIDSVKLTSLYKKLNFTINCFLLFRNETLSNYIC